jgi:pyruvate dehydrogenase E2 component (dihydrolipoamide acetyltransferase)
MPISILMPALSPTMTEGNLVKWHKKEGDMVKSGEVIAEIETDKATMEVEAVDAGRLAKIFVSEGTEGVAVNTLIAALLEAGESEDALKSLSSSGSAPTPQEETPASPAASAPVVLEATPVAPAPVSGDRIVASPLARRLASQNGIALENLQGTGPKGRIVKTDVDQAVAQAGAGSSRFLSVAPAGPVRAGDGLLPAYEEVKLTNVRKIIAKRLCESKQTVPHFYLTAKCPLDALLKAREEINATRAKEEKISVNDFMIKAMACALRDVPDANAAWGDDHIKKFKAVDISVAVAVEGGLVTPIIHDASNKSLGIISAEMKNLAQKARDNKLRPEEFQGGTASLSNLGMYGIHTFSAIINPPQGCIVAIGAAEKAPALVDGQLVETTFVMVTLSADHRVVDGAVGAQFLKVLKDYLGNPIRMIV